MPFLPCLASTSDFTVLGTIKPFHYLWALTDSAAFPEMNYLRVCDSFVAAKAAAATMSNFFKFIAPVTDDTELAPI